MIKLPDPFEIESAAREVGLSTRALCALAGVHQSTIPRWKSDKCKPSFRIMQKLLAAIESKRATQEHV